ncbi:LPP leucine zipper domain-containing protein [endosymbiont GvMRE of Glomus versiforme]|uniref:LPP leucine zipper domain-containing protein n=1 Tax=endosymbiont GvMRE of Glomus versiforme TaxID=2039283 RepID=UPI000ED70DFB|nr:LPP leucine zipper domain-containing protein [endosymbiont GvMRE of Glomus versiforme]RHZ36541.1 Tankyrase-2 [endosymbiont GvMRE of Glomus versiforme]
MTNNNEKPITEVELEQLEKKQGLTEKIARGAIEGFNSAVGAIGFKGVDVDYFIDGIKAGRITPNEILGIAEEITKWAGKTAKFIKKTKRFTKFLNNFPVVGSIVKGILTGVDALFSISSSVIDRVKDTCNDLAISSLHLKAGKAQKGIADVNEKVDAQGKAMDDGFNKLEGKLQSTKSELEGKLSSQGEEIGNLKSQGQRLESSLNNLSQAHSEFKAEVNQQFEEVNERVDSAEVKITKNARDILEEKLEREAIDNELRDKIKVNKIQLNNLKEEQEELKEDFQRYQTKTDRKLEEVHQEIENTQEEFTHQLKIQETKIQMEIEETRDEFERANNLINTKINQTQEILEEYEEEVENIRHDQKRLNVEFQELTDDVEEQFELIHQQTRKLDLVAEQMGEIAEETNRRMDNLENTIFDIEEQAEEALSMARKATRDVNQLTENLQKERKRIKNLEEQTQKNKQETKEAKQEAQRANERLDNLIKAQQLTDFSKEKLAFAKIQKSLQLKAEETKLLAQLNILQETKKLIPEKPAEREWKVGVKEGKVKEMPRPEGMPLNPNSRWAQEYTEEELREWGWDIRIKNEHESAPLTTPDRRKEETAIPSQTNQEQTAPETDQTNQVLKEQVESAKSQILSQIKEIQAQVNENLTPLEQEQSEASDTENEDQDPTQLNEQKEKELRTARAKTKAQLTRQQKQQATSQKEVTQLKSALTRENKKLEKAKEAAAEAFTAKQRKATKQAQAESQEKVDKLQKQLEQKQEQLNQQQQQTAQKEKQIEELQKEIQEVQQQSSASASSQSKQELQEEIEQQQAEAAQLQQEILEQQWQQISQAQEQVLEEQKESEESPPDEQAEEAQEQAEAEQEVKELEEAAAATQNQMTLFMLYLIIFLLEYIVYKRNGLPGLVILNICLAIAYYHKDTLMQYVDLWDKYVLIIGYIMGNVLTYNCVEKPEHKWPAMVGYNAIILAIWGYTQWKKHQINQKQETAQKKVAQLEIKKELTKNQIAEKELPAKLYNWEEKIQDKPLEQTTQLRQELFQAVQTIKEEKQQAEYVQQQEQIAQEQEQVAQELAEQQAQVQQTLEGIHQASISSAAINTEGLEEHFPGFQTEFERIKTWFKSILPSTQKDNLLKVIEEIKLTNEESKILSKLYLNEEQILAITLQNKKIKNHELELRQTFPKLTTKQKLKLLNAGLEALGLKSLEDKQVLANTRQQFLTEQQNFDLTHEEKENTLRFFVTALSLSTEQQSKLENLGITLFNASNWKTTEEHRQTLLRIGLEKIKLSEEEKQNLAKSKVKLSAQNENILKTLAPLRKEYKHSTNLLRNIQALKLKYESLSFFNQQQILPDLNTQFGTIKNPYQALKQQILEKEQKKLFKEQQEAEKEETRKRMQEVRKSLLPSLLEFAQNNPKEIVELELPIYRERIIYQDEGKITRGIESQEKNWVSLGAIDQDHSNLLSAHGFKSFKKYDFFDLLTFAWGNINPEINTNWEKWKNISLNFTQKLVKEWISYDFTYEQCQDWINIHSPTDQNQAIQEPAFYAYLRDNIELAPEQVLNDETIILEDLKEQFEEYQQNNPPNAEQLDWKQFLSEHSWLQEIWENYLTFQAEKLQAQWTKNREELAKRGEIGQEIEEKQVNLEELVPSLAKYVEDKIQASISHLPSYSSSQTTWKETDAEQEQTSQQSQSSATGSRYDDLFSNLSQEETERQKKKQSREEARKKLDNLEFNRREQNLDTKQQKLKSEEERRQRERELEEQELKARQQAFEARQKELKEQEEKRLTSQAEQIETKKKMAEEALAIKQKEAELAEQRKRAEIDRLEKENQQEQERLATRARLIEEEMQKQLAQIALEDQESRQRIEKECQERKAQLEREILELKRKNERDLMLKEQELEKEKQEKDTQIEHLRKEANLDETAYQEMQSKIAEEKEASAKLGETTSKAREQKMAAGEVHKKAFAAVYEYYLDDDEIASCTNIRHTTPSGSALPSVRSLFNQHPEMRLNIFNSKVMSGGESGEKVSMTTGTKFYYWNAKELTTLINKCLGSGSYSKAALEAKIKSISDPNFFN